MVKIFMRTFHPGLFVSEQSVKEVPSREVRPAPLSRAYAWQFFERECVVKDGETLLGEPKNHSPTYYVGEELSAEEAIARGNNVAKSNIEGNGYKRLVITKMGQMFPLYDGDVVVGEAGGGI